MGAMAATSVPFPRADACPPLYRPRNPSLGSLYQLLESHYETALLHGSDNPNGISKLRFWGKNAESMESVSYQHSCNNAAEGRGVAVSEFLGRPRSCDRTADLGAPPSRGLCDTACLPGVGSALAPQGALLLDSWGRGSVPRCRSSADSRLVGHLRLTLRTRPGHAGVGRERASPVVSPLSFGSVLCRSWVLLVDAALLHRSG